MTVHAIPRVIVGVDEVGLGALAGPLVVAAAAVPIGWEMLHVRDSKKLTPVMRKRISNRLWACVIRREIFVKYHFTPAARIDEIGIGEAHRLAIGIVVNGLVAGMKGFLIDDIIIDGNLNFSSLHRKVRSVIKADDKFPVVSAASVVAKVLRDDYMSNVSGDLYGFTQHKGYPTPLHKQRLELHGPGKHHRYSYSPVREAAERHKNASLSL